MRHTGRLRALWASISRCGHVINLWQYIRYDGNIRQTFWPPENERRNGIWYFQSGCINACDQIVKAYAGLLYQKCSQSIRGAEIPDHQMKCRLSGWRLRAIKRVQKAFCAHPDALYSWYYTGACVFFLSDFIISYGCYLRKWDNLSVFSLRYIYYLYTSSDESKTDPLIIIT